jgi:hypothetical protein
MKDETPDLYGLPVYRVSRSIKQRVGDEIHLIKGYEMFGQMHWSHVEIWKVSELLASAAEINAETASPPVRDMRPWLRKAH